MGMHHELRTLVETKGRNHKTDLHGDMSMCMNMYANATVVYQR